MNYEETFTGAITGQDIDFKTGFDCCCCCLIGMWLTVKGTTSQHSSDELQCTTINQVRRNHLRHMFITVHTNNMDLIIKNV